MTIQKHNITSNELHILPDDFKMIMILESPRIQHRLHGHHGCLSVTMIVFLLFLVLLPLCSSFQRQHFGVNHQRPFHPFGSRRPCLATTTLPLATRTCRRVKRERIIIETTSSSTLFGVSDDDRDYKAGEEIVSSADDASFDDLEELKAATTPSDTFKEDTTDVAKDGNDATAKSELVVEEEAAQEDNDYDESLEDIVDLEALAAAAITMPTEASPVPTTTTTTITKRRKLKFRMQLYQWLMQPKVEVLAAAAVLLSSFLVALSTLNDLPPDAQTAISATLLALDITFALDFFIRWYASGQFKFIYLTKPLALIDIVVVILPLLIGTLLPLATYVMSLNVGEVADLVMTVSSTNAQPHDNNLQFLLHNPIQDSTGLQNLLLLRVLRLRRVLTDMTTFGRFTKALGISRAASSVKPYQLQLARVLLSIFTLLSVSTGLIYTAEHDVNPLFADYFTALYFGLTTLTTVGFGDITPITPAGRLVVCASIIAGVAIIPAQAAKLVEALLELQKDNNSGGVTAAANQRQQQRSASNYATANRVIYSGLADGKGPSGVNIEMPTIDEQSKSMKRGLVKGINGENGDTVENSDLMIIDPIVEDWEDFVEKEVTTRCCLECGEVSHRVNANFCWNCGSEL